MKITLVDVIKKYETNIDTDSLIETFKNMVLFSDEKGTRSLGSKHYNITLDDIPELELRVSEIEGKILETYKYVFKNHILDIFWSPSEKKMNVQFDMPVDSIARPGCTYLFTEDGEEFCF